MNANATKSSESHRRFPVTTAAAGARLDKYLAETLPHISRTRLKALIEGGHVRIGGATIAEPAYRVKPGQTIDVAVPPPSTERRPTGQAIPLAVVYEDDDIVVIDKAAGMVVHPAPGNPDRTLVNALIAHCGDSLSGIGGVRRPGIVHRLDKDTSGLLVAAKHDAAHAGLASQFATRSLNRTYLAVLWGTPSPAQGTITGNIGRSPRNRKKMAVLQRGGKPAQTRYRTLRRLGGGLASLAECRLTTGRTHQIRVHMAARGHALLGDPLYGGTARAGRLAALSPTARDYLKSWKRQALHAYRLDLRHPVKGTPLAFESPVPADMERLIALLAPD